jgi:membrane protease YdiL (CAAX protease family)
MSLAEEQVLVDSANLTIIFMGVGLLAGMFSRRYPDWIPATRLGRVSVAAFGRMELGIAVGLIFFLYLVIRHPDPLRPLSNSVFVALGLSSYFVSRNCDLLDLFGLRDLNWRRLGWQAGVATVVITLVIMGIHQGWVNWLTQLVGRPDLQEKIKELQDIKDWGARLGFFFSACVLAPVAEEMVFRGFLYPTLKRFAHPLIAATVVAGMFAVIHLSLTALFPLFILSLLLTLSYEWTGSLLVPILVHAGFNLTNIIITLYLPHGA